MRKKIAIIYIFLVFSAVKIIAQEVIFRCDDFGLDEPIFYIGLLNCIKESNAKITIGAVPAITDDLLPYNALQDSVLSLLASSEDIEIALHGLSHRSWSVGTEFRGRVFQNQFTDISKAKKILESKLNRTIDTFIPPFNSYDSNTALALERLNFNCISGGVSNPASASEASKLKFIPSTISLYRFANLAQHGKLRTESVYIVLFHAYDFKENQEFFENHDWGSYSVDKSEDYMSIDLESFRKLLALLKQNGASFRTISDLVKQHGSENFSSQIIQANRLRNIVPLPAIFKSHHPGYLLMERNWLMTNRNVLIGIVFYLACFGLGFTLSSWILKISIFINSRGLLLSFISLISVMLMIASIRDGAISYRAIILISTYLGFCTSTLRNLINPKRLM